MKRIKLAIFIILGILFSQLTQAQTKFTATAPQVVTVGEPFVATYTVNANGKSPQFPDFNNFEVLSGPNLSQSSSISIINGNVSRQVENTYTFYLQANKEGKYTIPPASIKVKGKTIKSNSLTIEVVKGESNANNNTAATNTNNSTNTQSANLPNNDLFVKVLVNKSNVYQGEQLIATIKIYSRVDLMGFEDIKFPSYKNFWADEIPVPDQIQLHRENINGRIYNVGVLKKTILTPQKAGKLRIDPIEVSCVVRQRVKRKNYDNFFDAFFGGGSYRKVRKKIKSSPVIIRVKPLPPDQPGNFNGAVGTFTMDVNIDKTEAKTNDAITLTVKISGRGNLRLFDAPEVNLPPDFETYDPKETQKIRNTENGTIGSRTFQYVFIPRHAGTFEIPAIKFSYFDITTKKYKTLTSQKIELHIQKGNDNETGTIARTYQKEDIKYLGKDIHFIKQRIKHFYKTPKYYITSTKYYLLYLISLLIIILIIILLRKQIKENADKAKVRNKKALKQAKKRLKLADKAMGKGDEKEFYEAVAKALWQLLADKLNIPIAELTKDNATTKLKELNINEDLIKDYFALIEDADFQRFAPENLKIEMKDFYKKATDLIIKMNQKLG